MKITVEAHNVELSSEWRRQVEERLNDLSDPRDPIVSVRSRFTFNQSEIPPAEVSLVCALRGKNIVATRRGDTVDVALKDTLDTAKREIRRFYAIRSDHRLRNGNNGQHEAVPPSEEISNPES